MGTHSEAYMYTKEEIVNIGIITMIQIYSVMLHTK